MLETVERPVQRTQAHPESHWKKWAGWLGLVLLGIVLANMFGESESKPVVSPVITTPTPAPAPAPTPAPVVMPSSPVIVNNMPAPQVIERVIERPAVTIVQPGNQIVIQKAYPSRTIILDNPAVVHVVQ